MTKSKSHLSLAIILLLSACASPPWPKLVEWKTLPATVPASVESGKGSAEDLSTFRAAYRQEVYAILSQLHNLPVTADDNLHFVILEVGDGKYVQCILHDNDMQAYCEASSGFWARPLHIPMSRQSIQGVAEQGFALDGTHKNFTLNMDVPKSEDLLKLADIMLNTLYEGYGARIGNVTVKYPVPLSAAH